MLEFGDAVRLVNGLMAVGCGILIFRCYLKWETRAYFNLLWALGFMVWGVSIISRLWLPLTSPIILVLFYFTGLCFTMGTATLAHMFRPFFILYVLYGLTLMLGPSFGEIYVAMSGIGFFGIMLFAAILMRIRVGKPANWFIIGWSLTIIVNLFLPYVPVVFVDSAAIPAKIIFAYGICKPRIKYIKWFTEKDKHKNALKRS